MRNIEVTPEYTDQLMREGKIARSADGYCAIYATDAERDQLIADGELIREDDGILRVAHPSEEDFFGPRKDVPGPIGRDIVKFMVDISPEGRTIAGIREAVVRTFCVRPDAITDAMVRDAMAARAALASAAEGNSDLEA